MSCERATFGIQDQRTACAATQGRQSTENEGHEQGVSEVWDAEKVSQVGDEELLEIVDELDDQDEDNEVNETEHSDVSFDSRPSEELRMMNNWWWATSLHDFLAWG